jgi:hypothetical protein
LTRGAVRSWMRASATTMCPDRRIGGTTRPSFRPPCHGMRHVNERVRVCENAAALAGMGRWTWLLSTRESRAADGAPSERA